MLRDIWEPDLKVVFAGTAADELSDTLGFYFLHPRNRFWELLVTGGITPERIITASERKALSEGHAQGSLSDPVRSLFVEKKTSTLLKLGIGLTHLNLRILVGGEKDKAGRPTEEDIQEFIDKVVRLRPKTVAFVIRGDLFTDLFKSRYPGATATPGPQAFRIGSAEAWLLGAPAMMLRGEALTQQEDAFFALGERLAALTDAPGA